MSEELQHRDEFEEMLHAEADRLFLQPSKKIWQQVEGELHPRDRGRNILWLVLLLAALGAGGYFGLHHTTPANKPSTTAVLLNNNRTATAPATVKTGVVNRKKNMVTPLKKRPALRSNNTNIHLIPLQTDSFAVITQTDSPAVIIQNNPGIIQKSLHAVLRTASPGIATMDPVPFLLSPEDTLTAGPAAGMEKIIKRTVKKMKGVQWGLYFTPGFSYRSLQPGAWNQKPVIGFSAGAQVKWSLSRHWHFVTGAQVTQMGYNIHASQTYPAYLSGSGTPDYAQSGRNSFYANNNYALAASAYAPPMSKKNIPNSYTYTGIPLLLNYEISLKKRWALELTSGVGIDYLVAKKINILSPVSGRYFTDDSKINNWNSLFRFSPSLSVPIGARFLLQAGPDFQYQLFSTYKHYQVKEHPYNIGFRLGIGIR